MQAGSLSSSSIALMEATLGASILGIPKAFCGLGIPGAMFLLLAMGALSVASVTMIARAVNVTKCFTFEEVTLVTFGRRWQPITEVVMGLFCFGSLLFYLMGVSEVLESIFNKLLESDATFPASLLTDRNILSCELVGFILLPMSLCEKISDIRFVALAGVTCICLLVLCMFYLFCRHGVDKGNLVEESLYLPTKGFGRLVDAVSLFTLAYSNQPNIPQVFEELRDRTEMRFLWVCLCTLGLCIAFYGMVGISGFLLFGTVDKNILHYLKTTDEETGVITIFKDDDVLTTIALVAMCFGVMCTYPLKLFPTRVAVMSSLRIPRTNRIASVIITVVIVGLTLLCSMFLKELDPVLAFVGGCMGSIIFYIIPPLFCLRLMQGPKCLHLPNTHTVRDAEIEDKVSQAGSVDRPSSADQVWERSQQVTWYPKWYYGTILAIGCVLFVICTYQAVVDLVASFSD